MSSARDLANTPPGQFMTQKRQRSGFSLVELILVVVLLGVLVSLSLPNFRNTYKNVLLDNCSSNMVSLMRYAQSRAIIKRSPIRFIYDKTLRSYYLSQQKEAALDSQGKVAFERIANRWGRTFNIPTEIECDADIAPIGFYPNGQIDKIRFACCAGERCVTISTKDLRGRIITLEGRVN
jgi:prepilin-type N-terminal cleavage/methylation domain-containing protein